VTETLRHFFVAEGIDRYFVQLAAPSRSRGWWCVPYNTISFAAVRRIRGQSFFAALMLLAAPYSRWFRISPYLSVPIRTRVVSYTMKSRAESPTEIRSFPFFSTLLIDIKTGVLQNYSVLQHNEARQQLMRRNAAKPGQGRERMRGQFAGYIPANRAEKFREAERR